MAGAALAFDTGGLTVHQVVAVRPGEGGASWLPLTRQEWLAGGPPTPRPVEGVR